MGTPEATRVPSLVSKLRWAALVPAAIASWFAVFFAGLVAHGVIGEPLESYRDPDGRTLYVPDAVLFPIFAGLSAVAVVTTAVLIAPAHRVVVARSVWLAGTLLAGSWALEDADLTPSFLAAGAAGLVAAWWWSARIRRSGEAAAADGDVQPPATAGGS